MMRRFSRRRRGPSDGARSGIDGIAWWPRIQSENLIPLAAGTALETWSEVEVPATVAAIARGTLEDGTAALVAFSPSSASEALVGGLAAAQQASADAPFTGTLFVVAPHWPMATRQLLEWVGETAYSVEPIAAARLGDAGAGVESERAPRLLAASSDQLAARIPGPEARAAFTRAAASLEGLAAKHGGCVRVGIDRLELVVMARRVAEIRTDGENPVLETQVGGRYATPLSAADLAGVLDGLEGQLRRRLNDHKVRDGEDGLRARVVAQLVGGTELRSVRAWPSPGTEVDVVDAVGVDAAGMPVVVAVRQEFEWTALVNVLESLSGLAPLLPGLLAEAGPPLRLGRPRLVLAAERFAGGLERVVAALTLAFELRAVTGTSGAGVHLAQRAAGEGAESRFGKRGRRRGRGRSGGADEARGSEPGFDEFDAEDDRGRSGERSRGERNGGIPLGPRAMMQAPARLDDEAEDSDAGLDLDSADADSAGDAGLDGGRDGESGRGEGREGARRGRRRRRGRRGSQAGDENGAGGSLVRGGEGEGDERSGRTLEDDEAERAGSADSDGGGRSRARFEVVSLMDLDDAPADEGAGQERGDGDRARGDRHRRSRRRRRGGRGDETNGSPREAGEGGESEHEAGPEAIALPVGAESMIEDDFVDADDLSEILSRLPDEVPDYEPAAEPRYEDEDEEESEGPSRASRPEARGRGRGGEEPEEGESALRAALRRRCVILAHADPDSILAAILLARDVRQLDGLWVYPQAELMTFFRSIAIDLRDDTPIVVIGYSPSPARDVVQAASLYRGRLSWFDRHVWPPEDLLALRNALGADAVSGGEGLDSVLPLVLDVCIRRSRFSDKLVDLAAGRFSQHDFERWGRLWRHRLGEMAKKTGDLRGDIAPLLAGRPSDLSKDAALVALPPPPPELAWVAERDFRLVHFGAHVMVVLDVDPGFDPALCARIARERYEATLSLARRSGEEVFSFAGDEVTGRRALDYQAVAQHLIEKLEWVEARPDADHASRFRVRDLARCPERLEEVIAEIAMGRSQLER